MRRAGGAATALVLEGFFSRLSFGLLTFTLPLYAYEMGLSLAQIGLLTSTAAMVSLGLKPVLGPLADRWGLRRSLLGALSLRTVVCLAYALTTVPWQLFAARGVHGLSDAVRDPAVHALIAENGGKRTIATTFAWYQTAKTTAGSVGKSVAGVLLATAGGYLLAFGVALGLSLVPLLVVLALVPRTGGRERAGPVAQEPPPARPSGADPAAGRPPPVSRDGRRIGDAGRGLAPYAGLGFLVAGTSAMLTSLFPILATEYAGLSTTQAGLLYLVTPALAFTGPFWGWASDFVSRRLVLSVRGVANVGSALSYLLFPSVAGMWVGKSLDDVGKAAFRPAWGSLMAEVSDRNPRSRARTMAYLTSGEDAGELVAPVVAGLVWTGWGVPALLVTRMGAALLTEVYAQRLAGWRGGATRPRHRRPRLRPVPRPARDRPTVRAAGPTGPPGFGRRPRSCGTRWSGAA